jgi:acetyl-CoA acetyltransferase
MGLTLKEMRPVYVIGIGLHPYQNPGPVTYVDMGLTAIRSALADAEIKWPAVESAFVGTSFLGMAPGREMLRFLGATGLSISQVENASASGSSAFRQACIEVASGISDVSLAVGVDKVEPLNFAPAKSKIPNLYEAGAAPINSFALMASDYMHNYEVSEQQVAAVSVKNHNNAANNPFAQFQKARTLEEVMGAPKIIGTLTRFQCCPLGDGAAAVIVASEEAIKDLSVDLSRAVRVTASVSQSEKLIDANLSVTGELTRETAETAYKHAGISPDQIDIVELHDAFAVEELVYTEALGLCKQGEGAKLLESGATHIGGSCAVSPSGGLLAMGHPCGPTGVGQIVEITKQLRGEADARQQPDARCGLAHMIGVGYVCVIHILEKD